MTNCIRCVRNLLCALAATGLLGASLPATADVLGTTGFKAGSQSFGLSLNGASSSVAAGGYAGTWNASAIVFWCIELTQYFGFGGNYTDYTASLPGDASFGMLGQLFNEAYGTTTDAQHSAAFQLAIWEIIYDSDLDLHAGGFHVTSGDAATITLAQGWLNGLGNFPDTYNLVWLHSDTHQDFVTFGRPFVDLRSTVDEPVPLALLAVALCVAVVGRRVRRGAPSPREA